MRRNILYIFIFIAVIITACQEVFNPEIEQFPDALVVEGMVTDQNDYVTVKVSRSASFSDDSYFFGEKKAVVTIESTGGAKYTTTEISRGTYQTNEPVQTTVGEGYFVKIITSGNDVYESRIETMMPTSVIDSIYFTDSIFRDLNYNYWGEPVVKDYTGISIAVKPREIENGNNGYLYKWDALANYYVYSTSGAQGFSYFCWEVLFSESFYVYDYFHDDYIVELPVGDLHSLSYYNLSPLPIDSSRFTGTIGAISTSSFYYHLRQYTITKEGAEFWRKIKNQSEVSGKLFDPVEEQIYGNIRCVSDSNKVAFGYFNVASYTHRVIGVKLKGEGIEGVKAVEVMPIAPSSDDCNEVNRVSEFWF